MEIILQNIKVSSEKSIDNKDEETNYDDNDDVSLIFYGPTCECSKRSTCSTSTCLCKREGLKCNSLCHGGMRQGCKNI